jgi:hypothetical protein
MTAPAQLSNEGAASLPDRAKLGPTVAADLKALQADLEEAKRLAAAYEAQLVGKNSELDRMTELFEKTRRHLISTATERNQSPRRTAPPGQPSHGMRRSAAEADLGKCRTRPPPRTSHRAAKVAGVKIALQVPWWRNLRRRGCVGGHHFSLKSCPTVSSSLRVWDGEIL